MYKENASALIGRQSDREEVKSSIYVRLAMMNQHSSRDSPACEDHYRTQCNSRNQKGLYPKAGKKKN
jgi:hypothetical protein